MLSKKQIQNYVNIRIRRRAILDRELHTLEEPDPKILKLKNKIDKNNNELKQKASEIGESTWNWSIYDDSNIEMTTIYGSMDYEAIMNY